MADQTEDQTQPEGPKPCELHPHTATEDCSLCMEWFEAYKARMESKSDRINGKVQDLARQGMQPHDLLAHSIRLEVLINMLLSPVQRMQYEEVVADQVVIALSEMQKQARGQMLTRGVTPSGLHVVKR